MSLQNLPKSLIWKTQELRQEGLELMSKTFLNNFHLNFDHKHSENA